MASVSLEMPFSTFVCVERYKANGTYLTILFHYAAWKAPFVHLFHSFRGSDSSSSSEVQLLTPDRAF